MKWTEKAWADIAPIYSKILNLPFNIELSNGSLDEEKFLFYLAQDAYYLLEFGRALSAISSRTNQAELILAFAEFSTGAIVAERSLHESFFVEFGLPTEIKPSPSTLLYTNYILNLAFCGSVEVAIASVLPCFWVYKQVGNSIYSQQNGSENPYKKWIDMYSGKDFGEAVDRIITIADKFAQEANAQTKQKMLDAFIMATKLEWMFWDSAYQLETWKI